MGKRKGGAVILAAVFLLVALVTGDRPSLGEKAIVRAQWVERQGETWSVGLLYMQPDAEADAAEAKQKIELCWGSAQSLTEAVSNAEQALHGMPNYKLCDTVFVSGETENDTLLALKKNIENSKNGRLAAKILSCDTTAAEMQAFEPDAALLLESADALCKNSPRLYQIRAAQGSLLPAAQWDEKSNQFVDAGGLILCDEKNVPLSEQQTQAVRLLQRGMGTLDITKENYRLEIECIVGAEIENGLCKVHVNGLVRGLPVQETTRKELMDMLKGEVEMSLFAAWQQAQDNRMTVLEPWQSADGNTQVALPIWNVELTALP